MTGVIKLRMVSWKRNEKKDRKAELSIGSIGLTLLVSALLILTPITHATLHSHAQVARMRKLPIFTVVNKLDQPSLNGFEIIEQLEKEFGLPAYPVNW